MTLRSVEYQDPDGRLWLRGLPEGVPSSQAEIGIPIGPPPLDGLELPKEIEVRLHNQLYARQIFTENDARSHLLDLQSALVAALRVDVNRLLAVYQGHGAVTDSDSDSTPEPVKANGRRRGS